MNHAMRTTSCVHSDLHGWCLHDTGCLVVIPEDSEFRKSVCNVSPGRSYTPLSGVLLSTYVCVYLSSEMAHADNSPVRDS
ncbi:allantoin transport [Moniliophthora roreri]|nr:allantoin transport [Moniliophthora roreri]